MAYNSMAGFLPMAQQLMMGPQMGYYPGNQVAGFTPMQHQGWGMLGQGANKVSGFAGGLGEQYTNQLQNPYSVDTSQIPQVGWNNVGGMQNVNAQQIGQGPQVQSQQVGQGPQVQNQNTQAMMIGQNMPQIQGERLGQGQQVSVGQVGNVPQVGAANMDMFSNPFLKQSIQAGIDQNNENFNESVLTSLDADAIGAGMAGSSRAGIAQGLAVNKLNKANLDMASMLNRDAYNTGMGNWLNQRGQNLSSQTTNAANSLQSQGMNQAANLQAAGMNQSNELSRALANQSTGMQGQMANQNNYLQAAMANQGADLNSQQGNQQANMQGQLANQSLWGQTALANQANNMQGQLSNQNQWGLNQRANQQQGLMGQMANQNNWLDMMKSNSAGNMAAQGQNANNWLSGEQGNQNYLGNLYGQMPSMMSGYSQSMMMPGATMANIGNQQQQQNQNQINAEMNRWNWQRENPFNRTSWLANLTMGAGGQGMPGYSPSPGMDWGQGLGNLFGGMSNMDWGSTGGGGGYSNPGAIAPNFQW